MRDEKSLAVVGLGYVGLPLAVQATEKGYSVVGVDLNEELLKKIDARKSPYVNDERFATALARVDGKSLVTTNNFDDLRGVRNIVICVPTPTENNIPDLCFVTDAAKQVSKILQPGQLISLESTVNPGVTRDIVLPILENESGLKVGQDFYLAHCPERIDPGNKQFFVGNLNRVVGGITDDCTKKAVEFYSDIIDAKIIPLGSAEEAEFVKSWENTQRNVMIAMANSAAIICDSLDMDVNRVMNGLQSKVDQFGLKLAQPGIGPGGHCIPEDIHYVIKRARQGGVDTRFLDDAAELNDKMPKYAVHELRTIIKANGEDLKNLNVALLGLAYKPNIDDFRRSPSIEVGYHLLRHAKKVITHDPFYNGSNSPVQGALNTNSLDEALCQADIVFLGTAHDDYAKILTADKLKEFNIKYVLDGRNALDKELIEDVGIIYKGIGR